MQIKGIRMALDLSMEIPMSDILFLANAFKPSQWETVLVATLPAYLSMLGAWYLYRVGRRDKLKDDKKVEDDKKIKNLNILLSNLFQCIENQRDNLHEVLEYKKETEQTYKNRNIYVFKDDSNMDEVRTISNQIIVDLPEVSYDLNRLKNDLDWAKRYRELRDENSNKLGYEFYKERLDREEYQEKLIIKRLIVICLVLYDYATNLYPKKRILRITAKSHVASIWEYLIDDPDFNETKPFDRLQYKFKNLAIRDWFFVRLKNQYISDNKKLTIAEALTRSVESK